MNDLNIGQLIAAWTILFFFSCPLLVFFLLFKKKLSKTRFLRFLGILGIGAFSSLIPFGPFGLMMGFPAVITAAILTSLLMDKEDEQNQKG